jgi:hypothetical protein
MLLAALTKRRRSTALPGADGPAGAPTAAADDAPASATPTKRPKGEQEPARQRQHSMAPGAAGAAGPTPAGPLTIAAGMEGSVAAGGPLPATPHLLGPAMGSREGSPEPERQGDPIAANLPASQSLCERRAESIAQRGVGPSPALALALAEGCGGTSLRQRSRRKEARPVRAGADGEEAALSQRELSPSGWDEAQGPGGHSSRRRRTVREGTPESGRMGGAAAGDLEAVQPPAKPARKRRVSKK